MRHKNAKAESRRNRRNNEVWIDPNIVRKMKGSGGNRAFDPSAEVYRQAYNARQLPVVETTNILQYEIAHEEEKVRSTMVTIPVERPGKTRFPKK